MYTLFNRKKLAPIQVNPHPVKQKNDSGEANCLKLQRRVGQKIIVEVDGEIIEIILSEVISHTLARIVVRASNRVKIDREEIYIKKKLNQIT